MKYLLALFGRFVPKPKVPGSRDMREGTRVVVELGGRTRHGEYRAAAPDGSYAVRIDGELGLRAFSKVDLE